MRSERQLDTNARDSKRFVDGDEEETKYERGKENDVEENEHGSPQRFYSHDLKQICGINGPLRESFHSVPPSLEPLDAAQFRVDDDWERDNHDDSKDDKAR